MDLKKQLELYLLENGKQDFTWAELYDMFPYHGKNLSISQKGDKVRHLYKGLTRGDKLREEVNTQEANLQIKSKWQGPNGDWRYSYKAVQDGGMSKKDYQDIINNLDYKIKHYPKQKSIKSNEELMITFSDAHIGMSSKGNIFNLEWCLKEYYNRLDKVINVCESYNKITINILGDFTDGLGNRTARGGHTLEQNMNDKEMFKHGLESLIYLSDNLYNLCNKLEFNFLTNSNHPGVTDYSIGTAMSKICENRYTNVVFNVLEDFITRIEIDGNVFYLTHGYDEGIMTRGYPRFLTKDHINKIRNIKDFYKDEYPIILRGDLHQWTDVDYEIFRDIICPAFSLPSGWVSLNFHSKNKGGFIKSTFKGQLNNEFIQF